MPECIRWALDSASEYHFREWDDGFTLFLEGENSVSLISPFAVTLLDILAHEPLGFAELLDRVSVDYPDESVDALGQLIEDALAGLSQRGILIRRRS
ncbi:MAG TPA: hypothetical protein ENI97_11005 [Gammaproteobacteria bacterium]|nr:hypothetical protein [Gammaproteobacteria bacterium]